VLISNRVNIWREIEADRAGYIDTDDLGGITRLMERWLNTPDQDRHLMRTNARNCFARRYEIGRAIDSLLPILSASSPIGRIRPLADRRDSSRGEQGCRARK